MIVCIIPSLLRDISENYYFSCVFNSLYFFNLTKLKRTIKKNVIPLTSDTHGWNVEDSPCIKMFLQKWNKSIMNHSDFERNFKVISFIFHSNNRNRASWIKSHAIPWHEVQFSIVKWSKNTSVRDQIIIHYQNINCLVQPSLTVKHAIFLVLWKLKNYFRESTEENPSVHPIVAAQGLEFRNSNTLIHSLKFLRLIFQNFVSIFGQLSTHYRFPSVVNQNFEIERDDKDEMSKESTVSRIDLMYINIIVSRSIKAA